MNSEWTDQEFLTTENTENTERDEQYKIFSEFSVFCGFTSEFFSLIPHAIAVELRKGKWREAKIGLQVIPNSAF